MVHVVLYALVPFVLEEAVGANAIATAPPYHNQLATPLHSTPKYQYILAQPGH